LTGATDGIGLETAKRLVAAGHTVLIHGRSETKLANTRELLSGIRDAGIIETYRADLSKHAEVEALAHAIASELSTVDVIINNAGVFKTSNPVTMDGYDVRFIVNTLAPYLLTKRLLPLLPGDGRVINLSSAAQSPVSLEAQAGRKRLNDSEAYAQSKLAITMWSFHLARDLADTGPMIVAVNPGSLLASKMVKDAYGVAGNDIGIGADILVRAALDDEFADASGRYFDNDQGRFSSPHPDALDTTKNDRLVAALDELLVKLDQNEAWETLTRPTAATGSCTRPSRCNETALRRTTR
jgi:NAD(P)-dependent dehydrogenase (short-subunit alcohol dehydrogenase family)